MALPEYAAIRRVARLVEDGVEAGLRAYREGRAPDEPRLVERMLVEIEHAVSGSDINGLRWEAGTLSSHRRRRQEAAETRYGADFLGILEVQLPDYHVVKGFFAQAKLIASGDELGASDRERLREQCTRMLSITPDAFVFILRPDEVTIVPAISVNAGDNEPLTL